MNPIKLYLVLSAILCVSILYAEENTYIKQQVAYKDPGASGKELTWDQRAINNGYKSNF